MENIEIVGDKIKLYWSRLKRPDDMPGFIFGDKSHMEILANKFPYVSGFMRYSQWEGCYIMNFSKQNLKRIHAQWGKLPITKGAEKVKELKEINNRYVDMVHTCQKLKACPEDELSPVDYKLKPLGMYQHRGVNIVTKVPSVPLFHDCGLGKTFQVLVAMNELVKKGEVTRGKLLAVGKLNTLPTGWMEDCEKFTDLKPALLYPRKKHMSKEKKIAYIKELLDDSQYDVYLINHDGLRIYEELLTEHKFQMIALDESTILKGFHGMSKKIKGGQFGRSLARVAQFADRRVIMTGTPAPNGVEDLWGQLYFLDPTGIFMEPSYADFMEAHFDKVYFGKVNKRDPKTGLLTHPHLKEGEPLNKNTASKFVIKKGHEDIVRSIISPWMYRLKMEDCIDIPPLRSEIRWVELDSKQRHHYDEMKEALRVELDEEDTVVTASVALAKYGKLRQLSGGFIIDHDKKVHQISHPQKLDMLDQLLNEEIDTEEKVIIFCEYRNEVEQLASRYKIYNPVTAYGKNDSIKNLDNIAAFKKDPKKRLLIAHPQSCSHGVNLTEACYLIFYDISYSAEFNYQAIHRIRRATQKRNMYVFYLLAKNTIEKSIYDTVGLKTDRQGRLIDNKQDTSDEEVISAIREAL